VVGAEAVPGAQILVDPHPQPAGQPTTHPAVRFCPKGIHLAAAYR
jgi:hypothetical protein